jgi:hypothetical protein
VPQAHSSALRQEVDEKTSPLNSIHSNPILNGFVWLCLSDAPALTTPGQGYPMVNNKLSAKERYIEKLGKPNWSLSLYFLEATLRFLLPAAA